MDEYLDKIRLREPDSNRLWTIVRTLAPYSLGPNDKTHGFRIYREICNYGCRHDGRYYEEWFVKKTDRNKKYWAIVQAKLQEDYTPDEGCARLIPDPLDLVEIAPDIEDRWNDIDIE